MKIDNPIYDEDWQYFLLFQSIPKRAKIVKERLNKLIDSIRKKEKH